jgi:hypothetical protein
VNGVLAVQSRIAELQTRIDALSGRPPVAAVSVSSSHSTAGAPGVEFASMLDAMAGAAPSPSGPTGHDLIEAARKYLGVPYKWGGTDPATGLDCSALVQRAMRDIGVDVPRVVADQRHLGTEVGSLAEARPGDLIVLGGSRHIGIYVGDGKMLHAPRSGDVVKIGKVYETPTSIRRVLPEAAPAATSPGAVLGPRPAALQGTTPYDLLFASATQKYALPPGLLAAVARVESSLNPSAVSPAGARGLMQIMPGTARELGVDPMDPAQAVDGAARLLSGHLTDFGSVPLALAAYNAGPGAVRRYDGVPPYSETQNYVRKVTALLPGGSR